MSIAPSRRFIDWLDVSLPPVNQSTDDKTADASKDQNRDILVRNDCIRQTDQQAKEKPEGPAGPRG
jgi:hypothetical protein